MAGDPEAGRATVRRPGTSQLGVLPFHRLREHCWEVGTDLWPPPQPQLPAGPAPCQTHKDKTLRSPPRSFRTLNGKEPKKANTGARCGCTFVILRARHSSPHVSHFSTTLDVIKPQEMSNPAVTKPFVQTQSLRVENALKQFLIKLARR